MARKRAEWTAPDHYRLVSRLLEEVIRQARDLSQFVRASVATHGAATELVAQLDAAVDDLMTAAERLRTALFNYRQALHDERKHPK